MVRYESQPGSKMRMDGTSTIHDWHAESQLIGGFLELDAALIEAPEKAKPGKVAAQAETFVAVRSLKCSSGKAMDAVMQEAMKEKENPRIGFKLAELTFKEAKGAQLQFEAKGNLTVSGVTKEITFPVGKAGTRTMTAEDYLKTWALPNMFFHITTAYAILRHNGVVLGKSDFLAGAAA